MKLEEIAQIRTGLVLTRKKATIKYEIEYTYKLMTLKNIKDNGAFNKEPFEVFESNDKLDKGHFTAEGDILIKLSYPYTAVHIDKNRTGLLVPSYFAIIRLIAQNYVPGYVTWYLNSDKVKKEFMRSQTGTAMLTTNKAVISSIDIKEIPIEDQKKIAEMRELHLKEMYLLNRLIDEKGKYYKARTDKLLNKNWGKYNG